MRIGLGYDTHRLIRGRSLMLCGIRIPFSYGLKGHSDGDVGLHAVIDGILGAMGDADIGEHFPNTDKKLKGIASSKMLEMVRKRMLKLGYRVVNIDLILFAEKPHLSQWKAKMETKIGTLLKISPSKVNVKAKTGEGLGSIGQGKAMSAQSVVLLKKAKRRNR